MPQHNLRIIYNNLVDNTAYTITGSTGSTGATNLRNDTKSSVWRSGTHSNTSVKGNIVLSFTSQSIGGVVIPYCNLTENANIRVRAYTGTAPTLGGTVDSPSVTTPGTLVYDTGTIAACPVTMHTSTNAGANNYAYGTSRIARAWFDRNYTCTSVLIEITDTNSDQFVEIGKLIVGSYWSAVCNTKFGLGTKFADMTTMVRLDSGDTNIVSGPRYRVLSFEPNFLLDQDRPEFRKILQRNGSRIPMFVSLFPQIAQVGATPTSEEYDLEYTHAVYGRQTEISQLINSNYTVHSISLEIEEV